MQRKVVHRGGIEWEIYSRNERGCTLNGRHLFASRCRPGRPWGIREHDQNIGQHGSAKLIARAPFRVSTDALPQAMMGWVFDTQAVMP